MEELNINVSSFNEEEITQLLLKALKLSNEKSLRIKENVTKLEQQKRDDELEHEEEKAPEELEDIKLLKSIEKELKKLNKK